MKNKKEIIESLEKKFKDLKPFVTKDDRKNTMEEFNINASSLSHILSGNKIWDADKGLKIYEYMIDKIKVRNELFIKLSKK